MNDLLLVHGAIGASAQFRALKDALANQYKIHTLDFSGHGGKPMNDSFSIEKFADEVLDYLNQNQIGRIHIFGYSMGGYVALYLAKKHPERVASIFTLATKFKWTPEIAQREIKMLNADKIAEKIPAFASELQTRHTATDWRIVLSKTAQMMIGLGNKNPLAIDDFKAILNPVRIAIGDKDMMVTLEETIVVYRELPNATLVVFPDTQHPIEKVNVERLVLELQSFFG